VNDKQQWQRTDNTENTDRHREILIKQTSGIKFQQTASFCLQSQCFQYDLICRWLCQACRWELKLRPVLQPMWPMLRCTIRKCSSLLWNTSWCYLTGSLVHLGFLSAFPNRLHYGYWVLPVCLSVRPSRTAPNPIPKRRRKTEICLNVPRGISNQCAYFQFFFYFFPIPALYLLPLLLLHILYWMDWINWTELKIAHVLYGWLDTDCLFCCLFFRFLSQLVSATHNKGVFISFISFHRRLICILSGLLLSQDTERLSVRGSRDHADPAGVSDGLLSVTGCDEQSDCWVSVLSTAASWADGWRRVSGERTSIYQSVGQPVSWLFGSLVCWLMDWFLTLAHARQARTQFTCPRGMEG